VIGPKCVHCKKQKHHHSSLNDACPVGKRSRDFGYWEFSDVQFFEAKEKSKGGAAEARKDRKVRRATKAEPCCACGTKGSDFNPVDPAHLRTWKVTQSDHPSNMIPLCRECHRLQHREGWLYMIMEFGGVSSAIVERGWNVSVDPFDKKRAILSHPEIA
jgi:hypothetical protein